jgi:TctA family transporter
VARLRGPFIGFPFGAIPAGGAEIPTFLSYVLERRLSRRKLRRALQLADGGWSTLVSTPLSVVVYGIAEKVF